MIKIAVVEDDAEMADTLLGYLEAYSKENEYLFDIQVFAEALSFLDNYTPASDKYLKNYDIVFMDIGLPHLDGMSAARELRKLDRQAILIFITSLAKYVRDGYDVNALDFIIKPVSYAELSLKLKKAVRAVFLGPETGILISHKKGTLRTRIHDLYYIEVSNHKLLYHLNDQILEAAGTLSRAEKDFDKYGFLRCNSCFLINPRHVEYVKGNKVKVGNDELQISRPRRKSFLTALADYYA